MSLRKKVGTGLIVAGGLGIVASVAACDYHRQRSLEDGIDIAAIEVVSRPLEAELSSVKWDVMLYGDKKHSCNEDDTKGFLTEKGQENCFRVGQIYDHHKQMQDDLIRKYVPLRKNKNEIIELKEDQISKQGNTGWYACLSVVLLGAGNVLRGRKKKPTKKQKEEAIKEAQNEEDKRKAVERMEQRHTEKVIGRHKGGYFPPSDEEEQQAEVEEE